MSSAAVTTTTVIPSDSDEKYTTKDYVDENSVLPSYQSDEPGRNVGGLEARIRQEMETRIRAELEQKIRQEMEAKRIEDEIRTLQEAKRMEEIKRVEEAKKVLVAIKAEKLQTVLCNFPDKAPSDLAAQGGSRPLLFPPMADFVRREKVLFSYPVHFEQNNDNIRIFAVWLFITDEYVGVFRLTYTRGWGNPEIIPLYHFDQSLTMRDISILEQLYSNQRLQSNETWTAFHARITEEINTSHPMYTLPQKIAWNCLHEIFCKRLPISSPYKPLKDFELIIRLIPGSYKNGSWRPLDGFFGPYFNEKTLEIYPHAPPAMDP